ncbi:MAG TPA: thioredoxin domain-containing protein [Candidatus Saccharimonadales bacterium]|nr:thioredoxin domain-containing protein [Candidatus Saccharimonadales bacterium]
MSKEFIAVVIVVVVGLFGLFTVTKKDTGSNPASDVQPTSHTVGKGTKNVTLIEYGDLQCPACQQFYPLLKQIKEEYGDKITFQFRHFPLNQSHPHAYQAARAAEAAGKQGKFFEMHDLLYENQQSWTGLSDVTSTFEGFAEQIGLDIEQYKNDVISADVGAAIDADIKAGQAIGANATPTFVINGQKIEPNPQNLQEFKDLIDSKIEESNKGQ